MRPSKTTGSTAPDWIAEQVARWERFWREAALGAALLGVLAVKLFLGVLLWTAESAVYYALP